MKTIVKKIISLIIVLTMLLPFTVFAESQPTNTEKPKPTDIILYSESSCALSEDILLEGESASVSDGSIDSLPSMIEALDKRIELIENKQADVFSNKTAIVEDEYSLNTIFYLSATIKFNALTAATNDISVYSGTITATPDDFAIVYSQKGNIIISSSQINYNGIIYAPNGDVTINSSDFNFNGVIVAKNIYINSSQALLKYDARVEAYLPKTPSYEEECYSKPLGENDLVIDEDTSLVYVKNQVVLMANEGVEKSQIDELVKQYNAEIVGYLAVTRNYQIEFSIDKSIDELKDIAQAIEQSSLVDSCSTHLALPISLNEEAQADNAENTTSFIELEPKDLWWTDAINVGTAWDNKDKAQPVKVGIIDTKYLKHVDVGNVKILNDKYYKEPSDDDLLLTDKYHATRIAGIIGAIHGNGIGIKGVAPNAVLYNTPLLNQKRTKLWDIVFYVDIFQIETELETLIYHNDVKIINYSVAMGVMSLLDNIPKEINDDTPMKDGIPWNNVFEEAYEDFTRKVVKNLKEYLKQGKEFVIVQAAGNGSGTKYEDTPDEPFGWLDTKYACHFTSIEDKELRDRIIVVGSISDKPNGADKYSVSDFSQVGLGIDIYAPGHDIYSTHKADSYTFVDGTSFAAPQVAGVASMIWGLKPNLTGKEVKEILVENYTHTVKVPRTHPKGSVSYIVNSEQVFNKKFPVLDAKAAIDKITRPIYEIELTWGVTSPTNLDLYFCIVVSYWGVDETYNFSKGDMKVSLYKYGKLIAEFEPPKNAILGEGWNVFDIVNGEVIPVNTIQKYT